MIRRLIGDVAQLLAALALVALPSAASAMNLRDLNAALSTTRANGVGIASREWDNQAEERLVDRIDELADAFHELAADGTAMPKVAAALIDLAESTRKRYADVLAEIQAEIIRIDGDLEAAQDARAWRERELLAMRLLYRLNWLRYETAMRYQTVPALRKRLLVQARTGFAEFLGSGDAELTVESLLGHGLAAKALKDYPSAIADFRAALAMTPSPELTTRLLVPLIGALLASGNLEAALSDSSTLLAKASRGDLRSQALFLRAKALLLAVRTQPVRAVANKLRRQVAPVLEELYRRSNYWRAKVVQLVDSGIDSPEAWHQASSSNFVTWLIADSLRRRGQCDSARELYAALLTSDAFTIESNFGLGSCAFRDGDYHKAIDHLEAYLAKADTTEINRDKAAYLLFKAAESLYLQARGDATEQAQQRYIELLHAFIDRAPTHPKLFEAWYRLGEWHRDNHAYLECADAFGNVKGATAFEIKAGFLSGQCYVEAVLATPEDGTPAVGLVRQAISRLDHFLGVAENFAANGSADRAALVRPLAAKAVVMAAAIIPRSNAGTMSDRVSRLADFEQRFPTERVLLAEVYSLRIVAHRKLGDLDRAGAELEKLLALDDAAGYRSDSLKKLGLVFLEEAAKRDEEGDHAGALRSRQVALRVYQRLLEDAQAATASADSTQALERLIEDLRSQLSGS